MVRLWWPSENFGGKEVERKAEPPDQCCGSGMFFPDPGSEFFPSRIRIFSIPEIHIKDFKYFNPKKCFWRSRKYDWGWFRIRILNFYPSRIQGSKRHQIPDPDPQHCSKSSVFMWLGVCISWWKPKDWVQSEWEKEIKAKVSCTRKTPSLLVHVR